MKFGIMESAASHNIVSQSVCFHDRTDKGLLDRKSLSI